MNASTISPLSNRADWSGAIYVKENGEAVDTSSAIDLIVELEDPETGQVVLTASIGSGVVVQDPSVGTYTFTFHAAQTAGLKAKSYWFAAIIKTASQSLQLFKLRVPAYDGIVGRHR
ncbi:MAG: hypothetical protein AAGF59_12425 [Pseudomonadota bacterium]